MEIVIGWVLVALGVPFAALHAYALWVVQVRTAERYRSSAHACWGAAGIGLLMWALWISTAGTDGFMTLALITAATIGTGIKARMEASMAQQLQAVEWDRTRQLASEYGLPVPKEDR